MRPTLLLPPRLLSPLVLPLVLSACGLVTDPTLIAVTAGSISLFHRTPVDIAVSLATGQDCSLVHLDLGQPYCRPEEPPPDPPVFCTRTLGTANCWADPRQLPNAPREIADGPRTLTPQQEEHRTRRWPPW